METFENQSDLIAFLAFSGNPGTKTPNSELSLIFLRFPSSYESRRRRLTRFLVGVSAAGLPESHQGSEVGPQHRPAEGRHRVDAHQAADEGVFAALEQGHDVGTHVVGVLLPEVLWETETSDSALSLMSE